MNHGKPLRKPQRIDIPVVRWWRLITIVALLTTVLASTSHAVAADNAVVGNFPDFGAQTTSPSVSPSGPTMYGATTFRTNAWNPQLANFAAMEPSIAKVYLEFAHRTRTSEIQDLIDTGARSIILRTAAQDEMQTTTDTSDDMTVANTRYLLEQVRSNPGDLGWSSSGWADTQSIITFIQNHPDIIFWVEVGNEPDVAYPHDADQQDPNCPLVNGKRVRPTFDSNHDCQFTATDAYAYRDRLVAIANDIATRHGTLPNLKLVASMPAIAGTSLVDEVLSNNAVENVYDALGVHLYGDTEFDHLTTDGDGTDNAFVSWKGVLDNVRTSAPGKQLFVTEAGIASSGVSSAAKGTSLRDWMLTYGNIYDIAGVTLFTLTYWGDAPGLVVDSAMATAIKDRHYLSTTSESFGDFGVANSARGAFNAEFWSIAGGNDRVGSIFAYGLPLNNWRTTSGWRLDGGMIAQTFERQVMEWHPENADNPIPAYRVLLRLLGWGRAELGGYVTSAHQPICHTGSGSTCTQDGKPHPFEKQRVIQDTSGACYFFSATGFQVCGTEGNVDSFWGFYRSKGRDLGDSGTSLNESLAFFGYPISTHFDEKDANGNTYLVQYFERAVLEYHPANPAGQKVLMKRLGDNYGATDAPWPLTVMQVYRMQ